MKAMIRDRLNARLGADLVRDILFVSGSVESEQQVTPSAPEDDRDEPALIPLPPIADPALAAAFARVLRARAKRAAASARGASRRLASKKP